MWSSLSPAETPDLPLGKIDTSIPPGKCECESSQTPERTLPNIFACNFLARKFGRKDIRNL